MKKEDKSLYLIGVLHRVVSFLSFAFLLGAFVSAAVSYDFSAGFSLGRFKNLAVILIVVVLALASSLTALYLLQSYKVKQKSMEADPKKKGLEDFSESEEVSLAIGSVLQFLLVPATFVCALFSVVFIIKSSTVTVSRFVLAAIFIFSFISCLMLVFPRNASSKNQSQKRTS